MSESSGGHPEQVPGGMHLSLEEVLLAVGLDGERAIHNGDFAAIAVGDTVALFTDVEGDDFMPLIPMQAFALTITALAEGTYVTEGAPEAQPFRAFEATIVSSEREFARPGAEVFGAFFINNQALFIETPADTEEVQTLIARARSIQEERKRRDL